MKHHYAKPKIKRINNETILLKISHPTIESIESIIPGFASFQHTISME